MAGDNYYLMSVLLPLDQLDGAPPLSLGDLLTHVEDHPVALALVEAIGLGDDLLQRDAILAGEIDQGAPAVLSAQQLRDEQPLPEALLGDEDQPAAVIASDVVWGAYYRHLAAVAADCSSAMLAGWVGHEVALRNAIATARAKALELDAQDYLVEPQLADRDADLESVVSEWSSAGDPLAALRVLDQARWDWLVEHDAWFTFADDELAAYAAKLMLMNRWRRLGRADTDTNESTTAAAQRV